MSYTLSPPARSTAATPAVARPRLWPGVVIVALMWLLTTGPAVLNFALERLHIDAPPWIAPGSMTEFMLGMWAPIFAVLGLVVWWVLASRLPWLDRWLGLFFFLGAGTATVILCEPSFRMPLIFYALPSAATAWAGWLLLTTWMPWPVRRIGLALVLLLAWGFWTQLRFDGVFGDMEGQMAFRWTPTPEERYVAELKDRSANAPATVEPVKLSTGDWPGFRGPARDGRLTGVSIASDWDQRPPRQLWKQRIGPGWSSFAVVGGRIYTQEQRNDEEVVVCLDAENGEERWAHADKTRFTEIVAGPGPRATPTFHEGKVYAQGANGVLNCFDAATGKKIWSADVAKDSGAKVPTWGFASSPLVAADLVSVFAGGPDGKSVLAYKADSGKLAWSAGKGTHSYTSTQLARVGGVEQLLIISDAGAMGFDPASGKVLWEHEWRPRDDMARCIQAGVLDDGDVLLGTGFGSGTRRLHLTASSDGRFDAKEVWTTPAISPYYNDMVVHKGHIYGFDNMFFTCVNLDEGEKRWRTRGYGNGQVLLLADQDLLLVLSEKGEVVLLKADPEKHTVVGRFKALQGKTWNHPVVAHGKLFVRNGEEVACYQLAVTEKQALPLRGGRKGAAVVDARAMAQDLARLAWIAMRSFAGTLSLLTLAGFVLAGLSYYWLRSEPLTAAIAAFVAVVESVAAGVVLGGKRALVMALVEGVRTLGLARKVIGLIFDLVVGQVKGQHGERGGNLAQSLERLPLRQAEQALHQAVSNLVAAPGEGGWLRRRIRARLARLVEAGALTRFREQEAQHGGVDLLLVRDELEAKAEDVLIDKVRGGLTLWTVAVIVLLPLTVAVQTYIVLAWLRSHG